MQCFLRTMDVVEPMDCSDVENNQLGDNSCPKHRGLAIIAIFRTFKSKALPEITHVDEDRKLLEEGFRKLQYGVAVWDEKMDKEEFIRRLEQVSVDPFHENCETFALAIITHGDKNGKLYAYDMDFTRQDVCKVFCSENCSGLKNKFKLFIFHACRGKNYGKGVQASGKIWKDELPISKLRDHIEKDNLILCSTFEDKVAFAPEKDKGSFFIRTMNKVMKEEADKEDGKRNHILILLTAVIKMTASKNFASCKQQPVLMMALHKLYHFKNKEIIPEECLQRFQLKALLTN
ncbi:hypothetical protein J437_LFUL003922 [Ladona fulva]|uniref:Caspase family p20 domain-containing protein n=1 Tax=Ladona fulva TaxID=123851 RepID=A0A8K0K9F7_LADFU|nr:hypothetical protein J437_LFUL003922 [Ladona fulva]